MVTFNENLVRLMHYHDDDDYRVVRHSIKGNVGLLSVLMSPGINPLYVKRSKIFRVGAIGQATDLVNRAWGPTSRDIPVLTVVYKVLRKNGKVHMTFVGVLRMATD